MTVGGLVLAAGGSARMGGPKLLLPWRGRPLLAHVLSAVEEAGLARVVLVLGCDAERTRAALRPAETTRVVIAADWADGQAASLRRGVSECLDLEAVLVALGDQPGLTPERVRAVTGAGRAGVPLVVPRHEGVVVHPVLFARALFGELLAQQGDVGGRAVVARHAGAAETLALPPLADVDDDAAYRGLPP